MTSRRIEADSPWLDLDPVFVREMVEEHCGIEGVEKTYTADPNPDQVTHLLERLPDRGLLGVQDLLFVMNGRQSTRSRACRI